MSGAGATAPGALGSAVLVWVAVVCAGGAVLAARDRRTVRVRRSRALAGAPVPGGIGAAFPGAGRHAAIGRVVHGAGGPAVARLRGLVGPEAWVLVGGAVVALAGESPVPLLLAALSVPVVRRALRERARRVAGERRADEVIALCGALVGEVRAGRQPGEALAALARAPDGGLGAAAEGVLAAARFGGDVPAALGAAAREPGGEGLRGLAACWRVAVDQGAGLAAGLERVEAALRAERDLRGDLRAGCAAARATAVMLAGLPLVGLVLGWALGADPLRVLLHTAGGLGCLAVGGVLEAAGLWWALRIVRSAGA
ncbi:type II secretion system F family protein [Streptomyces sp. NPDC127068]|uniref:type II secretion system F family protein n=1 Tax=Streptomyces sp. NPDC127068 TaxID=3347127 RepID=UPI0036559512